MIQISEKAIDFHPEDKIKTIVVRNIHQLPIIFKVKTNNINAIDARPNTGSIQPNETLSVTVRMIGNIGDNVKLQVSYTSCNEPLTKENFKQVWTNNTAQQKSQTIPVRFNNSSPATSTVASLEKKQVQRDDAMYQSIPMRASTNSFISEAGSEDGVQVESSQPELQVDREKKEEALLKERQDEEQLLKKIAKINEDIKLAKKNSVDGIIKGGKKACDKVHPTPMLLMAIAVIFLCIGYLLGHNTSPVPTVQIASPDVSEFIEPTNQPTTTAEI